MALVLLLAAPCREMDKRSPGYATSNMAGRDRTLRLLLS